MDLSTFFTDFQDYIAPKLDVYEQAIYLYVFRHSRLIGLDEVVIGFKSAREAIASSYRIKGTPINEGTCYAKLRTLQQKGCLAILTSEQNGSRIRLRLPAEMAALMPSVAPQSEINLEDMDFFAVEENRLRLLLREGHKCFYCQHALTAENHVIEHVISRPTGNNSYKNVVAACRRCNNRKGESGAADFLRVLYREGFLSDTEFEQRLSHLEQLRSGELRPPL